MCEILTPYIGRNPHQRGRLHQKVGSKVYNTESESNILDSVKVQAFKIKGNRSKRQL